MKPHAVTVLSLLVAAGCAAPVASLDTNEQSSSVRIQTGDGWTLETATSQGSAVREYALDSSVVEAWNALPEVFAEMGFELDRADRRARIIGFEGLRLRRIDGERPSRYYDCGQGVTGPNADAYDVYLSVLAQVVPSTDGSNLRVRTMAYAENAAHGNPAIGCGTNGRLEERIAEAVRGKLAGS